MLTEKEGEFVVVVVVVVVELAMSFETVKGQSYLCCNRLSLLLG